MKAKRIFAVVLALVMCLALGVTAFADVGETIAGGIETAIGTIKTIINPVAVVAVIGCGLYCILGSDPMNIKKAKSWGLGIFCGLLLINLAQPIVNWAQSIAQNVDV